MRGAVRCSVDCSSVGNVSCFSREQTGFVGFWEEDPEHSAPVLTSQQGHRHHHGFSLLLCTQITWLRNVPGSTSVRHSFPFPTLRSLEGNHSRCLLGHGQHQAYLVPQPNGSKAVTGWGWGAQHLEEDKSGFQSKSTQKTHPQSTWCPAGLRMTRRPGGGVERGLDEEMSGLQHHIQRTGPHRTLCHQRKPFPPSLFAAPSRPCWGLKEEGGQPGDSQSPPPRASQPRPDTAVWLSHGERNEPRKAPCGLGLSNIPPCPATTFEEATASTFYR